MKYDSKTIGERIKKGRNAYKTDDGKKLTQEGLAEKLHYQRETVNRWEKGKELPSLDVLFKLCDVFSPCDLGFLLGEHEGRTRAATDIVKETGLTEEAAEVLQKYKSSADKRESYPASKFVHPDEFIPALISYMLTNDDFNRLVNRICSQNRKTIEYAKKIDAEKEIITEAYKAAQDHLITEATADISQLREQFQKEVKHLMIERQDEITKRFPADMVEGFYENIFIPKMQRTFDLARHTSGDVIEMNNFLNQKDMFNIVSEYMRPITKYRKEV